MAFLSIAAISTGLFVLYVETHSLPALAVAVFAGFLALSLATDRR